MSTKTATQVPKIPFYEPERNLPGRIPRKITAETRFTILFARAYLKQALTLHYGSPKNHLTCARQIAINGFGIADLVSIAWGKTTQRFFDSPESLLQYARPTIRAFEVKLNNWRKGMTQAHRYKYFANAAIVVLPAGKCNAALHYIDTFHRIRVGLWGFDPMTSKIVMHYTPRPSVPFEPKYALKVINIIRHLPRALPIQ